MRRRKIMWLLWLLICTVLWIFSENPGIPYLLAASVLVPLIGILWTLLCVRHLEASVKLDAVAEKDHPVEGILIIRNRGLLPCPRVSAVVRCRNCFTGENTEYACAVTAGPQSENQVSVRFQSHYCGRLELQIESLCAQDVFGLVNRPVKAGLWRAALILPDIYPASVRFADQVQMDPEGQEYSMKRAGGDPSETFAIREYHPGDSVKNIHWKLTEKMDEVMVRELGLPINHSVLLVFDTLIQEDMELPDAGQMDAMAAVAASMEQFFCDEQMPYRIVWYDADKGETHTQNVEDTSELTDALSHMLSVGFARDDRSALEHYLEECGDLSDAHVAVVTACPWPELLAMQEEGRITVLYCTGKESTSEGGFAPEEAAQVLRYIEI